MLGMGDTGWGGNGGQTPPGPRSSGDDGSALPVGDAALARVDPGMAVNSPVMVFDTDCVLCSGAVAFVLRHERAPVLRFMGAWSEEGLGLAARHGFSRADLHETFLVVDGDRVLTRSSAAIKVLWHLRWPWRWLAPVLGLLPVPLRNAAYGLVARRRYRWFGRRTDCAVVPPGERHRFIGVRGASAR